MASVAPFNRRQWASQSLRVTAKEMSIVSARGKNNAIAERFSKYQMAAEEGNAEKKKAVAEPLASTLRSGNLSVLKKRWEQQQQPSSHRAQPQTTPCHPADARTHIRHSTGPRPTRTSQIEAQPDTQDTEPGTRVHFETSETSFNQLQSAQPEDLTDMEAKPSRDSQGPEGAAAEVPDSEKPSVPLNSLKMMFEKGENLSDKVSREQTSRGNSGNTANMDELLGALFSGTFQLQNNVLPNTECHPTFFWMDYILPRSEKLRSDDMDGWRTTAISRQEETNACFPSTLHTTPDLVFPSTVCMTNQHILHSVSTGMGGKKT